MKVLFVTYELAGIFKVGGLGDVAAALPKALEKLGVKVTILMPGYNEARKLNFLPNSKVPIVYIKKPEYFDITKKHTHAENFERFFYFCQKVVEYIEKEKPDIVHLNDWHCGLIAYLLKFKTLTCHSRESGNLYRFQVKPSPASPEQDLPGMTKKNRIPKIILTIHNAGYQGDFALDHVDDFKNKETKEDFLKLKFKGRVNFLKLGVEYSDFVTTVSANYADEMLNEGQGYGLEKKLRKKGRNFSGILNGIDYGIWDPEKDKFIEVNYGLSSSRRGLAVLQGEALRDWEEGKKINKLALQRKLRLPMDANIPLLAFVARLSWQKGVEKIIEGISELAKMDLQLVVLGKGDKFYEGKLNKVKEKYADKFLSVRIKFDEKLAHLIYAGSDLFLIPSRYEPCGLTQMIAMKYGTIPVARKTGGLVDSIKDAETGFLFGDDTPKPMLRAIKRAIGVYYDWVDWKEINKGHEGNKGNGGKEKNSKFFVWERMVEGVMKEDFSWEKSAQKYLLIYKALL